MSQVEAVDCSGEFYCDLADVLINFRLIMVRAMTKKHGAQWFKSTCPPEVFDRLKKRKDFELSIDRYASDYQELIDFANFHDLAEMIFIVADVGELLKRLATSVDTLCNRLEELELLRCAIARARHLDEHEVERLMFLRRGFRSFLKGKTGMPPWDEEEARVTADPGVAKDADVPPVESADPPAPSSDEPPEAEEELKENDTFEEDEAEPDRENVPVPGETQPIEIVTVAETFGVEQALAAGDDSRVLGEIHKEVMMLAEEFYGNVTQRSPVVWFMVTDWYARHRDDMGLTALETFYGLVAEYRRRAVFGESAGKIERFIEDSRLPDLLMTLREVFLANKKP